MPQSIILHPPGGASGIKHWRYTAREKMAIVWRFAVLNGKPISPIARLLRDWRFTYARVSLACPPWPLQQHWYQESTMLFRLSRPLWSTWEREGRATCMDFWEEGNGASHINSLHHHQNLLPPASHGAEVGPCAILWCDALLLEKHDGGVAAPPPGRCSKRRRSSRTLSVWCSKDQSVIYAGSSTWTRCQYFFRCIPKKQDVKWFTSLAAAPDWCSLWTLATTSHSKRTFVQPGRSTWSTICARIALSRRHCVRRCLTGYRRHVGSWRAALLLIMRGW